MRRPHWFYQGESTMLNIICCPLFLPDDHPLVLIDAWLRWLEHFHTENGHLFWNYAMWLAFWVSNIFDDWFEHDLLNDDRTSSHYLLQRTFALIPRAADLNLTRPEILWNLLVSFSPVDNTINGCSRACKAIASLYWYRGASIDLCGHQVMW